MDRMKVIVALILVIGFGLQVNLHAQIPLGLDTRAENKPRENVGVEAKECIRNIYFLDDYTLSLMLLNPPELVQLFSVIFSEPSHAYISISKAAFFNHSPPYSI